MENLNASELILLFRQLDYELDEDVDDLSDEAWELIDAMRDVIRNLEPDE